MTEAQSAVQPPNPTSGTCGAQMREGFILDSVEGFSGDGPAIWYAGKPEYGLLGVQLSKRENYPVQAFRCTDCSRLELYAVL